MQKLFNETLSQKFPFLRGKKILVSISGGASSVALILLCKNSDLDLSLAHGHFDLRGAEGNADATFMRTLAMTLHVPFFVKNFDVENFAAEHTVSTQLAIGKLRYKWFEELQKAHDFDYILTTHRSNDDLSVPIRAAVLEEFIGIIDRNGSFIATKRHLGQNIPS